MSANCETPFWKDPTVLFLSPSGKFSGFTGCFENKMNAVVRTIILLAAFVFVLVIFSDDTIIQVGLILFFLTYLLKDSIVEKFKNKEDKEDTHSVADASTAVEPFEDAQPMHTMPTAANPFMNVLVDEVKYNPTRAAAGPIDCPMIQETLDNFYRVQWWADPTDVYGKNQGQRQFYTMPSTSVPSDRKSFQEWLFKIPGKTCKEGNRDACNPGTNGGAIPWLSQPN